MISHIYDIYSIFIVHNRHDNQNRRNRRTHGTDKLDKLPEHKKQTTGGGHMEAEGTSVAQGTTPTSWLSRGAGDHVVRGCVVGWGVDSCVVGGCGNGGKVVLTISLPTTHRVAHGVIVYLKMAFFHSTNQVHLQTNRGQLQSPTHRLRKLGFSKRFQRKTTNKTNKTTNKTPSK